MTTANEQNVEQVDRAVGALGPLAEELTLVGGCAVGMLITDTAAAPVRPTIDVDFVVEATTYVKYEQFAKRLESIGWRRGTQPGDPICRWRFDSLVVDVMPLEEGVLGFSNRWYPSAIQARQQSRLPSGRAVHHIDAPHFLATKLDAFSSRGGGDIVMSHDIEDVVRVTDGRASISAECGHAEADLRDHLRRALAQCLDTRYFLEALPGYFAGMPEAHARARIVERRWREIIGTFRAPGGE